jgi:hypothetical protein
MRCSRVALSLLLAVLGGLTVVLGPTRGRAEVAINDMGGPIGNVALRYAGDASDECASTFRLEAYGYGGQAEQPSQLSSYDAMYDDQGNSAEDQTADLGMADDDSAAADTNGRYMSNDAMSTDAGLDADSEDISDEEEAAGEYGAGYGSAYPDYRYQTSDATYSEFDEQETEQEQYARDEMDDVAQYYAGEVEDEEATASDDITEAAYREDARAEAAYATDDSEVNDEQDYMQDDEQDDDWYDSSEFDRHNGLNRTEMYDDENDDDDSAMYGDDDDENEQYDNDAEYRSSDPYTDKVGDQYRNTDEAGSDSSSQFAQFSSAGNEEPTLAPPQPGTEVEVNPSYGDQGYQQREASETMDGQDGAFQQPLQDNSDSSFEEEETEDDFVADSSSQDLLEQSLLEKAKSWAEDSLSAAGSALRNVSQRWNATEAVTPVSVEEVQPSSSYAGSYWDQSEF